MVVGTERSLVVLSNGIVRISLKKTRSLLGNLVLTPQTEAREAWRREREVGGRYSEDTTTATSIKLTDGHMDQSSLSSLDTPSGSFCPLGKLYLKNS